MHDQVRQGKKTKLSLRLLETMKERINSDNKDELDTRTCNDYFCQGFKFFSAEPDECDDSSDEADEDLTIEDYDAVRCVFSRDDFTLQNLNA
ncbi:MAG: hypothetical protein Q9192_005382 [Flavoplaca navasiana]